MVSNRDCGRTVLVTLLVACAAPGLAQLSGGASRQWPQTQADRAAKAGWRRSAASLTKVNAELRRLMRGSDYAGAKKAYSKFRNGADAKDISYEEGGYVEAHKAFLKGSAHWRVYIEQGRAEGAALTLQRTRVALAVYIADTDTLPHAFAPPQAYPLQLRTDFDLRKPNHVRALALLELATNWQMVDYCQGLFARAAHLAPKSSFPLATEAIVRRQLGLNDEAELDAYYASVRKALSLCRNVRRSYLRSLLDREPRDRANMTNQAAWRRERRRFKEGRDGLSGR